jgi:hypothetical protein
MNDVDHVNRKTVYTCETTARGYEHAKMFSIQRSTLRKLQPNIGLAMQRIIHRSRGCGPKRAGQMRSFLHYKNSFNSNLIRVAIN